MKDVLQVIGLMSVVFIVAYFLQYLAASASDSGCNAVSGPLACIVYFLWFFSFPVAFAYHFIERLHTNRLQELIHKEEQENLSAWKDMYKREFQHQYNLNSFFPNYQDFIFQSNIFDLIFYLHNKKPPVSPRDLSPLLWQHVPTRKER